jgi:hypothetical protein
VSDIEGEISLIDGEEDTVWRSHAGTNKTDISIDLGTEQEVTEVLVKFAGNASAAVVTGRVGANCKPAEEAEALRWERSVGGWDLVAVLEGVAAMEHPGRYLGLRLEGFAPSHDHFAVRDVIVMTKEKAIHQGNLSVEVNGLASQCADPINCVFHTDTSPEIERVEPSSGSAGTTITITGSQLAESCANVRVDIGGAECQPQSCIAGEITCTLGEQAAGVYPVRVHVGQVGAVGSNGVVAPWDVNFTYAVSIDQVTPTAAGIGGGLSLTISGNGFAASASGVHVDVCGVPCNVTSAAHSEVVCTPRAAVDFAAASGVGGRDRTQDIAVSSGADDAVEDMYTGAITASGESLKLSTVAHDRFDDRSVQEMFLRFRGLNVAQGTNVSDARLIVKSADSKCEQGTVFVLWAEASDDSEPFQPGARGSLAARARTSVRTEWVLDENWRWYGESQESIDISDLVNEVAARPGWRAGNSLTLIVRMKATGYAGGWVQGCSMLSRDGGAVNAAHLRVRTDLSAGPPAVPDTLSCDVRVSVRGSVPIAEAGKAACSHRLRGVTAVASSAEVGASYKDVYPKDGRYLTWDMARDTCASQGLELCTTEEIMSGKPSPIGDPRPFWDVNVDPPFAVPVKIDRWVTGRNGRAKEVYSWNHWLAVPDGDHLWGTHDGWGNVGSWGDAMSDENERRTTVTPCCGGTGHPAWMVTDAAVDTYWQSAAWDQRPKLTLDLGANGSRVHRVEIAWKRDFNASNYTIEARSASTGGFRTIFPPQRVHEEDSAPRYALAMPTSEGITIFGDDAEEAFTHLRINMTAGRDDGRVGVREIVVHGCPMHQAETSETAAGLLTVNKADAPTVNSVEPSRGSTAGGTDVTIRGNFFGSSGVEVWFGDFPCEEVAAGTSDGDDDVVTCKTSASGVTNGGMKHVVVRVADKGDSLPGENASFWYVDTWSARTTWGGASPPTGCGSWLDDPDCDASVVIPEGQVVLLDQSLPRFYLVLVLGTLIFDRKDIEMGASYILVNGGTLQIGTEAEPFMQNVKITM